MGIFDFFFQPKYVFFVFSAFAFFNFFPKMECQKYEKNVIGPKKKIEKPEKKKKSGLARNRLKLSKSPKNRFFDQYGSIYIHFLTKRTPPQKTPICTKIAKNAKFPSFVQLPEECWGV